MQVLQPRVGWAHSSSGNHQATSRNSAWWPAWKGRQAGNRGQRGLQESPGIFTSMLQDRGEGLPPPHFARRTQAQRPTHSPWPDREWTPAFTLKSRACPSLACSQPSAFQGSSGSLHPHLPNWGDWICGDTTVDPGRCVSSGWGPCRAALTGSEPELCPA